MHAESYCDSCLHNLQLFVSGAWKMKHARQYFHDCINLCWSQKTNLGLLQLVLLPLKYYSCQLSAGKLKRNSSTKSKDTSKNGNPDHIAAQTFAFRELATATRNFRNDCLLGEGGFGRVYKGRLESINQVTLFSHYFVICL